MRTCRLLASAVLCLIVAADGRPQERDKQEKKLLQGIWKVVTYGPDGVEAKGPNVEGEVWIKDEYVTQLIDLDLKRAHNLHGSYKLDTEKTPKQMDWNVGWSNLPIAGKMVGIYELTSDELKIAVSLSEKRPTDFTMKKGTNVLILKRAK